MRQREKERIKGKRDKERKRELKGKRNMAVQGHLYVRTERRGRE